MPIIVHGGGAGIPSTGQTTVFHVGDDGDYQKGTAPVYTVTITGAGSGTTNVDVPAYVGNTISFNDDGAGNYTILDSANGLATLKTLDTILIRNSPANSKVLTVKTGNVAGTCVVNESVTTEAAGAYVSICKREAKSNNTVYDSVTKKVWTRYVSAAVGVASGGLLTFDASTDRILHAANADLSVVLPNIFRIVNGAGEVNRYNVGDAIYSYDFANPVNNLYSYLISSVVVNGADLDIHLQIGSIVMIAESLVNAILYLECNTIFTYCAACNIAAVGGVSDWRVPNVNEFHFIFRFMGDGISVGQPDSVAFPSWPATAKWVATKRSDGISGIVITTQDSVAPSAANSSRSVLLVRG